VGLRAKVIDLVGLDLGNDAGEVGGIREVAVVELEARVRDMRILVDVIDALGVEERGAALDAVDFVAFFEEEFREVGNFTAKTRSRGFGKSLTANARECTLKGVNPRMTKLVLEDHWND